MKSLIIYYSYEGNCQEISKAIKEITNADVVELKPKKERKTKSLFRFVWGGIQVYMTKNPELEPINIDFDKYDIIFIGTPVWFGTYAPPFNTFFTENKIKNKNISLFCCSGNRKAKTFEDFKNTLSGNNIVGEIEFVYPIKNGIEEASNKAKEWAKECIKKVS